VNPLPLFAFQFFWFLAAWAVVARFVIEPRLRLLAVEDALALCIAPQMFRVLGVGLLVPHLSPDLPHSFALPTAIGDSLTAVLAMIAVVCLARRSPAARRVAWACTIVGAADLVVALPHAASIGAARYLTAQWYVPALVVPLMIVSHVVAIRLLLLSPQRSSGSSRP
jgi:hypothetical protein